jgi:hypothetical protein
MANAKKDDAGQAEAQALADKHNEQGFIGVKVDPLPNSAHSLASGPDAPTVAEQTAEALRQRSDAVTADLNKGE